MHFSFFAHKWVNLKIIRQDKTKNIHVSFYQDVDDPTGRLKALTDDPMKSNGKGTYFFNNKNVDGKVNCFEWLESQKKIQVILNLNI